MPASAAHDPHSSEAAMSYPLSLMSLVVAGELLLGIAPKADRITWLMENAPVFVLLPLAVLLQPKLKLSNFTLTVMAIHALVLMIGGHYTYAKVPVGFWVQDALDLGRNHYDRFGHVMQGFAPAVVLRELLIKTTPLRRGFLLNLTVVSMCLAFSALYELIEWWAALVLGAGADAFLGAQGDLWDTQWDMFLALVGASAAIMIAAPFQDRALRHAERRAR
ncbi:MAG TPA: DUF2238 domain-containing protein [Beijerinckiaceae bacterium]|nr:DUF2238 domain-containing protein [Beijerinckiaceae bacterium]